MLQRKYILASAGLAVGVGFAAGLVLAFNVAGNNVSLAQPADDSNTIVPGPYTNETIEKLRKELDAVAEYELAYGCHERDAKTKKVVLCGASKERVDALHAKLVVEVRKMELRAPEKVEAVKNRIRSMAGKSQLALEFVGTSANPYTMTGKRIEKYQGEDGMQYWVDPTTDAVVQFGPAPMDNEGPEFSFAPSLSANELKVIADNYLSANVADFAVVQQDFKFRKSQKNDGEATAFRWEAPTKADSEEMGAFVQVVVSSGGDIMSFNDTRSLY